MEDLALQKRVGDRALQIVARDVSVGAVHVIEAPGAEADVDTPLATIRFELEAAGAHVQACDAGKVCDAFRCGDGAAALQDVHHGAARFDAAVAQWFGGPRAEVACLFHGGLRGGVLEDELGALQKVAIEPDLTVPMGHHRLGVLLLNLAAENEDEYRRSMTELQRVIDLTRSLKPLFKTCETPFIIASVGGYTKDAVINSATRDRWYDRIGESIAALDTAGVEILPQTLPPFPWYFGGQLYLNLFVTPEDTAAFCRKFGLRLCFDVSHSKLTCNHFHTSFKEFTETVGPHTPTGF